MSRAMAAAPTIWPEVSLIGEMLTEMSNTTPSLRTRFVSIVLDALAAPQPLHDRRELIRSIRRDQERDPPADDLLGV